MFPHRFEFYIPLNVQLHEELLVDHVTLDPYVILTAMELEMKKTKLALSSVTKVKAGKKASVGGKLNAKLPNPFKAKVRRGK